MSVAPSVRVCVCARALPPPIAKRVQQSLAIQTGVPFKWAEADVREPRLFPPPVSLEPK